MQRHVVEAAAVATDAVRLCIRTFEDFVFLCGGFCSFKAATVVLAKAAPSFASNDDARRPPGSTRCGIC